MQGILLLVRVCKRKEDKVMPYPTPPRRALTYTLTPHSRPVYALRACESRAYTYTQFTPGCL